MACNKIFNRRWLLVWMMAMAGVFAAASADATVGSYSQINLQRLSADSSSGGGPSPIASFVAVQPKLNGKKISYPGLNFIIPSWILNSLTGDEKSTGFVFKINLNKLTGVQVSLTGYHVGAAIDSLMTVVNVDNPLEAVGGLGAFNTRDSAKLQTLSWNIPQSLLNKGENTVNIFFKKGSTGTFFATKATVTPQKIYAQNGVLNTTLYALFGKTTTITGATKKDTIIDHKKVPNKTKSKEIWTRGYGLVDDAMMIPAPTLYFKAGNLVTVDLQNKLDPTVLDSLRFFEMAESDSLQNSPDEVLDNAADAIRHEVNIPHNLNNTNLHVHGLHVDPAKDDVTIVIVPDDESGTVSEYDAPTTDAPDTSLQQINEYSVADQKVKGGSWPYVYRIPPDHLPGTHWYHPHKHGSTAAQVENGMAGSIVIEENPQNAVLGEDLTTQKALDQWAEKNDHVFMIQEIANYGTQQGGADGGGQHSKTPDVTVNGLHQPTHEIPSDQLQRWRFVNAGANHKAFSHIWLGQKRKDGKYTSATMSLVAFDGITLDKAIEITAANPILLAPGNRADVLVKFTKDSDADLNHYALFKYYPDPVDSLASDLLDAKHAYIAKAPPTNPYLFAPTGIIASKKDTVAANMAGFHKRWKKTRTSQPLSKPPHTWEVVPLLKAKKIQKETGGDFLAIDFSLREEFPDKGRWQPRMGGNFGGGATVPALLMHVEVADSSGGKSPAMPSENHLRDISPVGMGSNAPLYARTVADTAVLQSRPVIFDVSGAAVRVADKTDASIHINVNQFTLNGRPFALNDPIGNATHKVEDRLQRIVTDDSLYAAGYEDYEHDHKHIHDRLQIDETLTLVNGITSWSNEVEAKPSDDYWLWVNPGYFQNIEGDEASGYYFDNTSTKPTWQDISGLDAPALVNNDHNKQYHGTDYNGIPGMPVAQTAEEWILINNSAVGHPFHIHINPFFVTEVGQLSYERFSDTGDKGEWLIRAISTDSLDTINSTQPAPKEAKVYKGDSPMGWFVGQWWDTVIVPPHGYVKVRYRMNVPDQPTGDFIVNENSNKVGIWVYHCHILRHEDRGMMMPVVTQLNERK